MMSAANVILILNNLSSSWPVVDNRDLFVHSNISTDNSLECRNVIETHDIH